MALGPSTRIARDNWLERLEAQSERLSSGNPWSIQNIAEPTGAGETVLRFELRSGDAWSNRSGEITSRAEIETRERPPIRSVRWYRFEIYLPPDFPTEDTRLVLAQWHGSDKKYLGEPARSPVMAFRYKSGSFYINLRHSTERIVRSPDTVPVTELFKISPFPLNAWNDFIVHANWSFDAGGWINIWWNGRRIVQYRGPVGYNDDLGPYFQFGLYRDDTDKTYVSYMKQIKMGSQPEDVDFNMPTDSPLFPADTARRR